ncbi:hypothetical protein OIO90_000241 [Microbotryomycetes sp. JL221]|nr:hypothetical protein OIO90_000241 [Microbotryomycetes sp. JL221]
MAPADISLSTFKYSTVPSPDEFENDKLLFSRSSDAQEDQDEEEERHTHDQASFDLERDALEFDEYLKRQQQRRTRLKRLIITTTVIIALAVIALVGLFKTLHVTTHRTSSSPDQTQHYGDDDDLHHEQQPETATATRPTPSGANSTSTSTSTSTSFKLHFHGDESLNDRPPINVPSCPITVEYTNDEQQADAVIWNSDSYDGLTLEERQHLRQLRPNQKHVIWGSESAPNRGSLERYYQSIDESGHSELYDADMTYRLNGSVPGTYSYDFFNYETLPIPYKDKRQDKIAAAFVSNCNPRNARTLILSYLMELLPGKIDSFGRCVGNADAEQTLKQMKAWEEVGPGPTRWNIKIATMKRYKFAIAFENSNDLDYVTEKFFQPLEQGVVPLTFGAPDMERRFFPSPNAAIDVGQYVSAQLRNLSTTDSEPPNSLSNQDKLKLKILAKKLLHLSSQQGQQEYELMLNWKQSNEWKSSSPLGKIVKLNKGFDRDCKLVGVLLGLDWSKSNWIEPDPPGPMDEIWKAIKAEQDEDKVDANDDTDQANDGSIDTESNANTM